MSLINKMLHDLKDRQADLVSNEGSIISDIESADEIGEKSKIPQSRFISVWIIVTSLLLVYMCYEVFLNPFFTQSHNNQQDISKPSKLTYKSRVVALPLAAIDQQATTLTAPKEIYSASPTSRDLDLKLATLNPAWISEGNHVGTILENIHPVQYVYRKPQSVSHLQIRIPAF